MRKGKILLFLVLVVTAMFVVSCVQRQAVIPDVPTNLRVNQLVGVVGVELRWDAVAGATGYQVIINNVGASGSRSEEVNENTSLPYYLAYFDDLGEGTFDWTVDAWNTAGHSNAVQGPQFIFEGPEPQYGLDLELEQWEGYGSGELPSIYVYSDETFEMGQRREFCSKYTPLNFLIGFLSYAVKDESRADPNQKLIQFMVQSTKEQEAKRWPDSNTEFLLDENDELEFYVENLGENFIVDAGERAPITDPLTPGDYYLWARAQWDESIESVKVPFSIKEFEGALTVEFDVYSESGEGPFGGKICPTATEVTLRFDIDIEDSDDLFGEMLYVLNIGQTGETGTASITKSATFTEGNSFQATATYATECTKYATLTVSGTLTIWEIDDDGEPTSTTEEKTLFSETKSFVLDMADPIAAIPTVETDVLPVVTGQAASITTATITFAATDTKCLQPYSEKIKFEVYVDKGRESWSEEFYYGTTSMLIGSSALWTSEASLTSATYTSATSTLFGDTAAGTLVLHFKDLDYATVTGTMTVNDCCCPECVLEDPCFDCGVGDEIKHATTVVLGAIPIDNIFFSSMKELENILTLEGFLGEEGATPTIPVSQDATLTILLADANWGGTIAQTGWEYDSTLFSFNPTGESTKIEAVCSGYATKTQLTVVGAVATNSSAEATEIEVTLTGTAVDLAGNEFLFTQSFLLDTLAPTLTHFTAFRDQFDNESWIEFAFDQKPETAELALTVTASGTFLYDLTKDASPITGQANAYKLFTGITLPFSEEITLEATAKDLAGNIGFSTKTAEVSISSPR